MVFKGYCVLSSTFTLLHELVQLTSLCISCFICIVRMIAVPTIGFCGDWLSWLCKTHYTITIMILNLSNYFYYTLACHQDMKIFPTCVFCAFSCKLSLICILYSLSKQSLSLPSSVVPKDPSSTEMRPGPRGQAAGRILITLKFPVVRALCCHWPKTNH